MLIAGESLTEHGQRADKGRHETNPPDTTLRLLGAPRIRRSSGDDLLPVVQIAALYGEVLPAP